MFDIAKAISDARLGRTEDFLKIATTETSLISEFAPRATSLEGYLFPNTYQFTRTQSMHDMAAEMVKEFRVRAAELGLSGDVQKTVTLASIIEKEADVSDERPQVARVYVTRLATHIQLQVDLSRFL